LYIQPYWLAAALQGAKWARGATLGWLARGSEGGRPGWPGGLGVLAELREGGSKSLFFLFSTDFKCIFKDFEFSLNFGQSHSNTTINNAAA